VEDAERFKAEQDAKAKAQLEKNKKHKEELEVLIKQRQKIAEFIANSSQFMDKKKQKE
jgi:hypothetical protein